MWLGASVQPLLGSVSSSVKWAHRIVRRCVFNAWILANCWEQSLAHCQGWFNIVSHSCWSQVWLLVPSCFHYNNLILRTCPVLRITQECLLKKHGSSGPCCWLFDSASLGRWQECTVVWSWGSPLQPTWYFHDAASVDQITLDQMSNLDACVE